jgi:hypothetical protein
LSFPRSKMTMRAVIKRGAGTDGYGGPAAAQPLVINPAAPCFVYTKTQRLADSGGVVASVQEIWGLFRAGEDLKTGDVIDGVQDRAGNDLFPGPMYVQPITPRGRGSVVTHLEAQLKRTR